MKSVIFKIAEDSLAAHIAFVAAKAQINSDLMSWSPEDPTEFRIDMATKPRCTALILTQLAAAGVRTVLLEEFRRDITDAFLCYCPAYDDDVLLMAMDQAEWDRWLTPERDLALSYVARERIRRVVGR